MHHFRSPLAVMPTSRAAFAKAVSGAGLVAFLRAVLKDVSGCMKKTASG